MKTPQPPELMTAPEFTGAPITRGGAAALGLKLFFTGKPCIRGHVARRYVSTGGCTVCHREHSAQHQAFYKALRIQRAIGSPWLILQGTPEQLETVRAMATAFGVTVKEIKRGPGETARAMQMAPPEWKPPAELVNPTLSSTHIVSLKSGMGADAYSHIGEITPPPPIPAFPSPPLPPIPGDTQR